MTTFAGLVRVSHMGDRDENADDFHSGRDQVADIERGVPRGATLALLPPELNVSGGLPLERRPSLLAAIEGVENGRYDGIVVAYLSRLGRSTREQLRAWDRVEAAGGRIICVKENIDTSTPTGRFMRTILLANAEREREEHADRFDDLRRWATENGIWQRRQTPRGYVKDPATRRLTEDAQSADGVRDAFRARAAGAALSTVARNLGMTRNGARHLLANRVYLGELRVGEYVNPEAHPPIITPEEFAAVQTWQPRPARRMDTPALLAGLARCQACGHLMTRTGSTARGRYVHAYNCASWDHCPSPASITLTRLDAFVWSLAEQEYARLKVTVTNGDGAAKVRAQVEAARAELEAFTVHTRATDTGYADGLKLRRDELADAEREERTLQPLPAQMLNGRTLGDLDDTERGQFLRGLLSCVIVRKVGRGRTVAPVERVRVMVAGFTCELPPRRSGAGTGVLALPFLDLEAPYVLRPLAGEDSL